MNAEEDPDDQAGDGDPGQPAAAVRVSVLAGEAVTRECDVTGSGGKPDVATADGTDTTAHIQPDGHLKLATGDAFRKPDDAARAVTGKRTEGMLFWHVTSPDGTRITLRQLRDQAKPQLTKPR